MTIALVKLEHVLAGIYIWEYFTTLEHEWRFFRGDRGLLSTTWIYSVCRFSALIFTVVNLVGLNVTSSIDCNAWIISRFVFAAIAVNSGYLIAIVRISAIWERNLFVILPLTAVWLASIGFWLHETVIVHAVYVATQGCVWITTTRDRPLTIVILAVDVILLFATLAGLAWRGAFKWSGLWSTIYLQGVVWLSLAIAIEVPDVVVNILQLDSAWNQMLRSVELFIIVIGVTRTHSVISKHSHFSQYSDVSASKSTPSQFDALHIQDPRTAVPANSVFAMGSLSESRNRTDHAQETSLSETSAKITHLGNDIGDLEAGRPAIHVVQVHEEDLYGEREKDRSQASL
ncbi:hypothetical protein OF83DRAFT_152262 [Amylostereum chailletii]|nr:hypothetical protein OF83DRAFT_152262 [Amylostereum chailletii]